MTYSDFLAGKAITVKPLGLAEAPGLSPVLFPFQRDVVSFALQCGRGALFLDTGLGKTICQLEYARHAPGDVLILAPLAVAGQTVREAHDKLGLEAAHSRDGRKHGKITVANYERLHLFDLSQFSAVVLDESSILKSFMGKTKRQLCDSFAEYPFRLACTATPAPNDYMELGNHSEFLGVMDGTEMLTRWFINDTMNFGNYRLKGHAEKPFWEWVASWAACVSKPSDLGYDDADFALPPLKNHLHSVATDYSTGAAEDELFRCAAISATTIHAEKRMTLQDRVGRVADLCRAESGEAWIVWCETNDESAALAAAIPDAVEVKGADSLDAKEDRLEAFASGRARVIVSKPSICGFGLNWQHCARVAFASLSYSYEQFYQAIRRSWRFGQKRPVEVHSVISESEMPIWQTIQNKLRAHEGMKSAMRHAVFHRGRTSSVRHTYAPQHLDTLPKWLKKSAA